MRRVVVAVTAMLVALGGAVVVSYLFLFSAVADRASQAAPADTALYLNVYLQPSTGQQMNLFGLIGKLPGFGDPATLEEKIDEVAQRLLGQSGIDYVGDVRPWLGQQIALAVAPGEPGSPPLVLLLAGVKDSTAAGAAVARLMASSGVRYTAESYRGHQVMTSEGTSYALLEDLLVVASTPARLRAALDADADTAPSLADTPAFRDAMREVASDHLASLYLDLPAMVRLQADRGVGGYRTSALALTADADGLHLNGMAAFSAGTASDKARAAFALGGQPSALVKWMPRTTSAELVVFGLAQTFADLEASMATAEAFRPATDALNQLRGITALGLGITVDRDLLPLFDGEVAVALGGVDADGPHGQLLLRPGDPDASQAALDRMRGALVDRGSTVSTSRVAGTTITRIAVPQIGEVAYAVLDGVVLLGMDPADVAAALEAHAAGRTLAADDRYTSSFELAGEHAGNELWADVPALVDALAGIFDPGSEVRDILHQIGELAMSASANDDRLDITSVLTVK